MMPVSVPTDGRRARMCVRVPVALRAAFALFGGLFLASAQVARAMPARVASGAATTASPRTVTVRPSGPAEASSNVPFVWTVT